MLPMIAIFRGMLRGFCEAPSVVSGFRRAALCAQFSVILAAAVFAAQAAFFTHEAAAQSNVAADMTLRAEIEKTPPSLVTVRHALAAGANPNATVTGGLPLLFEAGRRGHAEIVSVLVTFGVNASVQVNQDYFPEYMAPNGLSGSASTATVALSWRRVADVMIHFGDAVRAFGLTSGAAAYDWSATQGRYHVLVHLGARYNNYNPNPEEKRVMEAIGGYVLDQGAACPGSYADSPICASRPSCPTTGGVLYSCSECGGYPHLSADGAACVAAGECRSDATLNTEVWPASQCECDHGDAYLAGGCPSLLDKDLAAAVENSNAVLSSVRALLEAGANPNATATGGLPLLFEAGRRGHAEIVSVLVTFGVNASVKIDNKFFPEHMSENGLSGSVFHRNGRPVVAAGGGCDDSFWRRGSRVWFNLRRGRLRLVDDAGAISCSGVFGLSLQQLQPESGGKEGDGGDRRLCFGSGGGVSGLLCGQPDLRLAAVMPGNRGGSILLLGMRGISASFRGRSGLRGRRRMPL